MVNGTDPGKVKAYRCDSIEVINFGDGVFKNVCTSWRNSTYADINFFSGINSTDTDVLMPRQLSHHRHSKEATLDLNSYYRGPNTQRVTKTMIQNGLVVEPHEQGVRMIPGVPQLTADHKVDIEKTLAVEVDVGCMATGITSIHLVVESGFGVDLFQTNGTWREYTGPDYMQDILSKAVDDARAYYEPFFNKTTLSSTGSMFANDGVSIGVSLSIAANVRNYRLSTVNFSITDKAHQYILGNCTQALQNRLGIAFLEKRQGSMCNYLGIGGSIASDGAIGKGFRKMICASAAQINMVSATVSVDANQAVSVNVTRRPSDLNFLSADYWDASSNGNKTFFLQLQPYVRYTMSDNPNANTTHFIPHIRAVLLDNTLGIGSAGDAISAVGHSVVGVDGDFEDAQFAGLGLLEEGLNKVEMTTNAVTRWVGQVGASYIFASIGYNGWAARDTTPIQVLSTGGVAGSCYKPIYALGFVPLIFAAIIVLCWAILMVFTSSLFGCRPLKEAYGGLGPYTAAICPGASPKDTLLAWESSPQPRLQLIAKGYPVMGDAGGTALKFLKSGHSYP